MKPTGIPVPVTFTMDGANLHKGIWHILGPILYTGIDLVLWQKLVWMDMLELVWCLALLMVMSFLILLLKMWYVVSV